MKAAAAERFAAGVVKYDGGSTVSFGADPFAVPVRTRLQCRSGPFGSYDIQVFANLTMSFTSRICLGYPLLTVLIMARPTSCKVQKPAG